MARAALPLAGRSVVVTRAAEQATALRHGLARLGAAVVEVPTISIAPTGFDVAARMAGADWVVFASPNAVAQLQASAGGLTLSPGTRVAAIGPGTAAALARVGVTPDMVPRQHVAEGLVDAFPAGAGRVFIPQAEDARNVLADGLRRKGWQVDVAVVYRTVPAPPSREQLDAARSSDAITFTSPSTVAGFVTAGGLEALPPVVVCIGPVTAEAARKRGIDVAAVADPHTIEGLVDAVALALRA